MTDPVTERFTVEERSATGGHDSVVMHQYIAQPGGEYDPYKAADFALAGKVRTYLLTRFPVGYEWCVRSDLRQRVVMISIPLLMGVTQWMVINLTTTRLDEGVLQCAGEILERYRQSRTRFNLAAFLDAREQHSALVVPTRGIPG